ncbi:MAG: hypothetical protein ACR2P5_00680 [Gammaproteobacteria bacterium]
MFDTMKIMDTLCAAGFGEKQARALVGVMQITRGEINPGVKDRVLDTAKIRDILLAAGFGEKQARAVIGLQKAAREKIIADKTARAGGAYYA